MKKSLFVLLAAAFVFASSSPALARDTKTRTVAEGGGTSSMHFGMGVSSWGGGAGANTPTLSGYLDLMPQGGLQIMLAVLSSDPFSFSVGSVYRHTIFGTPQGGMHVGFGFDLGTQGTAAVPPAVGTSSTFFLNLFPVIGFQVAAFNNVRLMIDGGMNFHVTPSPFQFQLGAASGLLGASIHYFL